MEKSDFTRLRARARRLTGSEADAEDLCQDVWLAVMEREAAGARIARPLPYMMTALRHAAMAHTRSAALLAPLEDNDHPRVEDASLACFCSEVLSQIDSLPKPDRALLRRVAFDGATPSEMAEELGTPVGTIMSRLARARARLRARLEIEPF